jgi:hypothetical protein
MTAGLLLDNDDMVADWASDITSALSSWIGLLASLENRQLVGAALFSSYNTMNADFSYYGDTSVGYSVPRRYYELNLSSVHYCT